MENKWKVGQWYRGYDGKEYLYVGKGSTYHYFEENGGDNYRLNYSDIATYLTTEKVKQKIKVEGWVNVYQNGSAIMYRTPKDAHMVREDDGSVIACKHIAFDVIEGEGLE